MHGQNISILSLLNNTVVDEKGQNLGRVKDLIFTTTGLLKFIVVVATEGFNKKNIYFAVPFQFFTILPPSVEQVVFQGNKHIIDSLESFNKNQLPDFYSDIPIYGAHTFLLLIHQNLILTQSHRTDQDNY